MALDQRRITHLCRWVLGSSRWCAGVVLSALPQTQLDQSGHAWDWKCLVQREIICGPGWMGSTGDQAVLLKGGPWVQRELGKLWRPLRMCGASKTPVLTRNPGYMVKATKRRFWAGGVRPPGRLVWGSWLGPHAWLAGTVVSRREHAWPATAEPRRNSAPTSYVTVSKWLDLTLTFITLKWEFHHPFHRWEELLYTRSPDSARRTEHVQYGELSL